MKDRVPKYPGRVKITHADGTSEYVTLERADEPVSGNEGTPLNKATLLSDDTAAELKLTGDDPTVDDALKKLKTYANTPAFCYLFDVKKAWLTSSVSQSEFKIAMAKAPDSMEMFMGSAFISPDLKHVFDIKTDRSNYSKSFGQYRIGDINIDTGEITWSPIVELPAAYTASYAYTHETVCDIDNDGVVIMINTATNWFVWQYIDFNTKSAIKITSMSSNNTIPKMSGQVFDLYPYVDNGGVYYATRHNSRYILLGLAGNQYLMGYDKVNKVYASKVLMEPMQSNGVFIKCTNGIVYESADGLLNYSRSPDDGSYLPRGDASGVTLHSEKGPSSHFIHDATSTFASGTFLHASYEKTVSGVTTWYELTYDLATIDPSTSTPKLLSVASKVGEPPFGKNLAGEYPQKQMYIYDDSRKKLYANFYKSIRNNNGGYNTPVVYVDAYYIKTRNLMFDYDSEEETHLYIPRTVGALTLYGLSSNHLTGHTFIKIPWLKNVVLSDFGLLWIDADNLKAV